LGVGVQRLLVRVLLDSQRLLCRDAPVSKCLLCCSALLVRSGLIDAYLRLQRPLLLLQYGRIVGATVGDHLLYGATLFRRHRSVKACGTGKDRGVGLDAFGGLGLRRRALLLQLVHLLGIGASPCFRGLSLGLRLLGLLALHIGRARVVDLFLQTLDALPRLDVLGTPLFRGHEDVLPVALLERQPLVVADLLVGLTPTQLGLKVLRFVAESAVDAVLVLLGL